MASGGPFYQRGNIALYTGDFRVLMRQMPAGKVEAVITDPPYARAYAGLWPELGYASWYVLAKGGSLLAIMPHYLVPQITEVMSRYLKFRWILAMNQTRGSQARMAMGVRVTWKPIGWWVKGSWPRGRGFIADGFDATPAEHTDRTQKLHEWQQGLDWAKYCLGMVPRGRPVVDPMVGSGTLLAACLELGYPAIGIEYSPAAAEIAATRLEAL